MSSCKKHTLSGLLPIILAGIVLFMAISHQHVIAKKYLPGEETSYELSIDADDDDCTPTVLVPDASNLYSLFFHEGCYTLSDADKASISTNSVRFSPWNQLYILFCCLKTDIA